MSKTIKVADAVARIPDGAVLMIGGFMGVGTPHRLVAEIVRQRKKGLTAVSYTHLDVYKRQKRWRARFLVYCRPT